MPCISTDALPMHVNTYPPLGKQTDEQVSNLWTKAAMIISDEMKTSESKLAILLKRVDPNVSGLQKDYLREQVKHEISTALEAGEIPLGMVYSMTMVFANLPVQAVELAHVKPGASIVLYLKCQSVWSLSRLTDIVLNGDLLRLLSDVIEEFTESQRQVQLLIKAEEYNSYLSYLCSVAGKSVRLLLLYCKV